MPISPAVRTTARTDSAPLRWPSTRGRLRCFAQRPFPSMMIATCVGKEAFAAALRWIWGGLISDSSSSMSLVFGGVRKSGRGLPQSKTLARDSEAPRTGEAFGLRQSSAALANQIVVERARVISLLLAVPQCFLLFFQFGVEGLAF